MILVLQRKALTQDILQNFPLSVSPPPTAAERPRAGLESGGGVAFRHRSTDARSVGNHFKLEGQRDETT